MDTLKYIFSIIGFTIGFTIVSMCMFAIIGGLMLGTFAFVGALFGASAKAFCVMAGCA